VDVDSVGLGVGTPVETRVVSGGFKDFLGGLLAVYLMSFSHDLVPSPYRLCFQ